MPRSSVPPFASHAPPLGALLRQYSAGSALTCHPVEQGLLNRGYRLATTRGDYFLKHHFDPETADPAAIARQHRATQRLADLGVPVAPPLPGRDGRTVAVVGGHAYALHPWIDGRHRHGGQLTTVQCDRLGALLGVVHASLERVMPRRGRALGEQGEGGAWAGVGPVNGAGAGPGNGTWAGAGPRNAAWAAVGPGNGAWASAGAGAGPRNAAWAATGPGNEAWAGAEPGNGAWAGTGPRNGAWAAAEPGNGTRAGTGPANAAWAGTGAENGVWAGTGAENGVWAGTGPANAASAGTGPGNGAKPGNGSWAGCEDEAAGQALPGPRAATAGLPQPPERGGVAEVAPRRDAGRGGVASRPGRVAHHRSTARRIGSADGRNRGVTHAEPAEDAFGTAHAPGTPVEPPSTADRHRLRHPHSPDRPRDPAETHRPTGPDHSYRSDHSADPADTQPSPSADPSDTFALIDDLLAHVRRHRPTDAFDELARHRLLERRALLERHADRRPPPGGSVGWVHGDFHPFNVLYKGDSPAAIVDWDRLGVRPRAEEAVRAAAIFFVQPAGTLDLPKIRAYARAYRRTAGATPSELAAAVHRVWWERLNDFWMLRWHYERGDTRADSQFPAASALAVWWTREYDTVCEAFVA